jgi:hypothetical protein
MVIYNRNRFVFMRIIFICLLGFIGTICDGQNLENTSWTSVKITRKDGSTIIPGLTGLLPFYAVKFERGQAGITSGFNYYIKGNYHIEDSVLTIENLANYNIEYFNDTLLVFSTVTNEKKSNESINRYYLLNDLFYLDYLRENNLLVESGDSLIGATNYLYPRYTGEGLYRVLRRYVVNRKITGFLTGTISLNSAGEVYSFQVKEKKSLSENDQEALSEFFIQSRGNWDIPYHLKKSFKIDFFFKSENPISMTYYMALKLNCSLSKYEQEKALNERSRTARELLDKGQVQLTLKHYEKAIGLLNECIRNDSTFLDAHYNKAFALYNLGDVKGACQVWKQLESWGQKTGEEMVNEYCKE